MIPPSQPRRRRPSRSNPSADPELNPDSGAGPYSDSTSKSQPGSKVPFQSGHDHDHHDHHHHHQRKKLNIVFVHPDLGIGGAERLVIDAAVGLQDRGHKVTILTSHRDVNHCFDEARDGTLDVRVRGNTIIPPSIKGRFKIVCAIGRQVHLVVQTCLLTSEMRDLGPSVLFIDQLSASIPLLKLVLPRTPSSPSSSSSPSPSSPSLSSLIPKILFYCHFPDKLLALGRSSLAKRLYRLPFDELESWSTGLSDGIAVNSNFTKSIFASAFPRLAAVGWDPDVVYPSVDVSQSVRLGDSRDGDGHDNDEDEDGVDKRWAGRKIILSLNRFERKKLVGHAIEAFSHIDGRYRTDLLLVIAGGHDPRVAENCEYLAELETMCKALGLNSFTTGTPSVAESTIVSDPSISVLFLLSIPSDSKFTLLRSATMLVYTPPNEHFGIVPLEAMLCRVPVLADTTGGPTETVVDGETGWLRDISKRGGKYGGEWTKVMEFALDSRSRPTLRRMGMNGRRRVMELFTKEKMAERLEEVMYRLQDTAPASSTTAGLVITGFFLLGLLLALIAGLVLSTF